MVQPSKEKEHLTGLSFELVILEAHKARSRQGYGQNAGEPNLHPQGGLVTDPHSFNRIFQELALRATPTFHRAYEQARAFGAVLAKRRKGGGFMKNLMEQRVCSSVAAGINTAKTLLKGRQVQEDTEDSELALDLQTDAERAALVSLITALEGMNDDPKLRAIRYYLKDEGWLELGCIIFSQNYDTARWVADSLAAEPPARSSGSMPARIAAAVTAMVRRSASLAKRSSEWWQITTSASWSQPMRRARA